MAQSKSHSVAVSEVLLSLRRFVKTVLFKSAFLRQPGLCGKLLTQLPYALRSTNFAQQWRPQRGSDSSEDQTPVATPNPLREFFESRQAADRGIWKVAHYFDIYQRHFSKFVGRDVHVLEIGVYSGGSLAMWKHYFGPLARVYGVDREEACKSYENDHTAIFIGDQENRAFWKAVKERIPVLDIVVDDGGHEDEQQIAALEELLPHLRPGGVYLCEDIGGEYKGFSGYMHGLVNSLNTDGDLESGIKPTAFQAWINSIHSYAYVTVVEKADVPTRRLISLKRGTEWQPFFRTEQDR